MPVGGVEFVYDGQGEEIGVRIYNVGRHTMLELLYADIPGNSWNPNRLNQFRQRAQDLIDYRINRADHAALYPDDPAILSDPAQPNFFWDGNDLVARPVIIENISFESTDDEPNPRLRFSLRRVSGV